MKAFVVGWTIVALNLAVVVVQGAFHMGAWSTIAIVFCQGITVGILVESMVILRKTIRMIRRHDQLLQDLTREEFED